MEDTPTFRPEMFDFFGGQFDSDVIDLDDREDFRAETVAHSLLEVGLTPEEVSGPLRQALENLTPEVIERFSVASNGWWDCDEDVEAAFRSILERIAVAAGGGGAVVRRIAGGGASAHALRRGSR